MRHASFHPVMAPHRRSPGARRSRRGFTMVEVLAAMLILAIALPAVMQAITTATLAASIAHRRTEAAGLASSKLAEIVATQQWDGGSLTGDFSPDWPDYKWQAVVQPWSQDTTTANVQQIDVIVTWRQRNRDESVKLSTVAYARGTDSSGTGSSTGSGGTGTGGTGTGSSGAAKK